MQHALRQNDSFPYPPKGALCRGLGKSLCSANCTAPVFWKDKEPVSKGPCKLYLACKSPQELWPLLASARLLKRMLFRPSQQHFCHHLCSSTHPPWQHLTNSKERWIVRHLTLCNHIRAKSKPLYYMWICITYLRSMAMYYKLKINVLLSFFVSFPHITENQEMLYWKIYPHPQLPLYQAFTISYFWGIAEPLWSFWWYIL